MKLSACTDIFECVILFAADRAKAIKTVATVNESPTDKLIRELREENAKLMDMLKKGNIPPEMLAMAADQMGSDGGGDSASAEGNAFIVVFIFLLYLFLGHCL